MSLTIILLVLFFLFIGMSLIMQLYQNRLLHNMDVPVVTKTVDVVTESEEII